ncbi:MAG TPA: hypothetical protein VMZ06_13445 [Candidatus Bathyarchaeia archaeon]|nr:hypothetical protein [Candidatus Bathyarchaeia archaeon]
MKPNRSVKAAAILVAAAASMAILFAANEAELALTQWFMTSGGSVGVFGSFIFAVTALMLVSYRYADGKIGRGFAEGVLILATLVGFVLGTWPFPVSDMQNIAPELPNCALNIIVFVVGLLLARRLCRHTFSAFRLTLAFTLAAFLPTVVLSLPFLGFQMSIAGQFGLLFMFMLLFGLVIWPFFFALVLFPFVLLVTRNSLYRERMKLLLRLPSQGAHQPEVPAQPIELPDPDPSPPAPPESLAP